MSREQRAVFMRQLTFLLILGTMTAVSAYGQYAQVTDLGANVFPVALNNSGQVVGSDLTSGTQQPFLWSGGTLRDFAPGDWTGGVALGINSSAVICGQAFRADARAPFRPYTWDGASFVYPGNANDIGSASAINDSGIVGGFRQDRLAVGFSTPYAFVAENGVVSHLPDLGGNFGEVRGINSSAVLVGDVSTPTGRNAAVMWSKQNGEWTMSLLPLGGAAGGVATRINDAGRILGFVERSDLAGFVPVIWQPGTTGYELSYVPVPSGSSAIPLGINTSGQIVGVLADVTHATSAFVYSAGTFTLLDTLAGATGWHFSQALSISDNGEIVGSGIPDGGSGSAPHGFVLQLPQTPSQIIASMLSTIDNFNLNGGTAQSLKAKLSAIEASLGSDRTPACNQLNALVNEINAQDERKLSAQQAAQLRSAAAALSTALGC